MVEHVLDALILQEQLRRGLRAHAGHARDIVRVVPHQPFHVDQADRGEAVLLLERSRIVAARVADAFFGQNDSEIHTDELQGVAVARHNDGLRALCRRLRCKRADDVVRLVVVQLKEGNAERSDKLLQQRNLGDQFLGRLVARALVRRIERRAERRAALVERYDDLCRRKLL